MGSPSHGGSMQHVRRTPLATRTLWDWGLVKYRLDVVALSVADAVKHAGGWLFDRATAGWEVTVLIPGAADDTPLRILGAELASLDDALATGGRGRTPHAIAMAAGICLREPMASEGLHLALLDRGLEVVVWGEYTPPGSAELLSPVEYRLSMAARAFKTRAMKAAGLAVLAGPVEDFRSGATVHAPIPTDLGPAGPWPAATPIDR
ncbi:hypothetical protein AB0H71_28545 [Nocardia sp. NPDC050697]|uniref:hypothetical protein n=1 Tax=Nocardia sp. NPDC050697 TaxID=3155158 RepID=UPI0033DA8C71